MIDDDKSQFRINRGYHAKRILDDEQFQAVLADLELEYIAEWKATADPRKRGRMWCSVKVIEDLKKRLQRWQQDGGIVQKRISES